MKKPLLLLVTAAALAAPSAAFAWSGRQDHHGVRDARFAAGMKLSGTGTSFGSTSASITGTSFRGTLATAWSSTASKTFLATTMSCAPATASITVGTAAAVTYTGKTCSFAGNDATRYVFFGKASNGARAFLGESGTTVMGAVFAPRMGVEMGMLVHAGINAAQHHRNRR